MARNSSLIDDLKTRRQTLGWSVKEVAIAAASTRSS